MYLPTLRDCIRNFCLQRFEENCQFVEKHLFLIVVFVSVVFLYLEKKYVKMNQYGNRGTSAPVFRYIC